jgi:hypothetical protein
MPTPLPESLLSLNQFSRAVGLKTLRSIAYLDKNYGVTPRARVGSGARAQAFYAESDVAVAKANKEKRAAACTARRREQMLERMANDSRLDRTGKGKRRDVDKLQPQQLTLEDAVLQRLPRLRSSKADAAMATRMAQVEVSQQAILRTVSAMVADTHSILNILRRLESPLTATSLAADG